ncbi:MAG: DUF3857 domain-containing protein [Cyclobacteriaceae bacterium]|jgi:transglutaminase-like putative cysteine protease|nr:DUF2569 family protein [Flammeovirgaceae bacterium]
MRSNPILCLAILFFLSFTNSFSQHPAIKKGPKKSWIEDIGYNKNAMPEAGQESSYYYLLVDEQENVEAKESYTHNVYKFLSNEGLQEMSDLNFEFDPTYEQLVFHSITILRDGKEINQLPVVIKTIQREQDLDRNLYDGSLTAIVNLKDVRVGDIVEYAYTRKGYNPVFENFFSRWRNFNFGVPVERFFLRFNIPTSMSISLKSLNNSPKPTIQKKDNATVYTWDIAKQKALLSDKNEPAWYYPYNGIVLTNFKNWQEVAQWSSKRYQVTESDFTKVKNELLPQFKSETDEEFALEAIRFVQDEIRYLGFESGLNSHKPHSPIQVFQQRFGDCKDKSLLLATLLNARGIESNPVLVNTSFRDKLAEQLPLTGSFDHCVVQIKLNNEVTYVDPTISSQGGTVKSIQFPNYGKGLVVNPNTKGLTDFPDSTKILIHEVFTYEIDSIGGAALLRIETTYEGSEADYQRSYYAENSLESIQKGYIDYYGNLYSTIEKSKDIEIYDNRTTNTFKVKENYRIKSFWNLSTTQSGVIYCELYPISLENYFSISNKSSARKAPYRLVYPLHYSNEMHLILPEEWPISPDEKKIESDYYDYHYRVIYENKFLTVLTDYTTKKESIPVADFAKYVEDHGKMMNNLRYQLTYNKNLATKNFAKWPGILVSFLSLMCGLLLAYYLYTRYDPAGHYPAAQGIPIGGWLILPSIGLCITPLRITYDLVSDENLLSGNGWLSWFQSKEYGYALFIFAEHIYNVVFLVISILTVILFFQRRTSLPKIIIIIYIVSALLTIADNIAAYDIDPNTKLGYRDISQSIVGAAIWIPYFMMSQRVKRTFVNTYGSNPESRSQPII